MNSLFNISKRSMLSLRSAMNATAQNVANANTEGFSRRRVTMEAQNLVHSGTVIGRPAGMATGAGVAVASYDRVRDDMLGSAMWEAGSGLGGAREEHRILSTLEGVFPAGENALEEQIGQFWNAWSSLADDPTGSGARVNVRTRAATLAGTLNQLDTNVVRLQEQTTDQLTAGVEDVNSLLSTIATLNTDIASARFSGTPDLAAEDQRDQLVKSLSEYAPIRVKDEPHGYTITMHGMNVVQAGDATHLAYTDDAGTPRLTFEGTNVAFTPKAPEGGRLGAWTQTLTQAIPDTRDALDAIAATLVAEVNALHQTGFGADGVDGRDFFNPAALSAGSIALSADVLADPDAIAASGVDGAAGDSSVASAIADLQTQKLIGGTKALGTFAIDLSTDIGSQVRRAGTQADGNAAVRDHLGAMVQSISGVSIEEEMTSLITYQQSFAASARVLNTAQQMMDTLLAM